MTTVSVIMPVYNVQKYVTHAIHSVLVQTYQDFEIIIIDDQSPDKSIDICKNFKDDRIRIIHQQNLGLAGARNTGIHHAVGKYIALLDADDYWAPEKLECHVAHLESNPKLGISYSSSEFVDDEGCSLGIKQTPKLKHITTEDIFCRNPVGNGSAPVIRKAVFDAIAFPGNSKGINRDWYFDESFKQSEDIECWLRMATQTDWQFEGIAPVLTYYRVNDNGLSANVVNQFYSWKRACEKLEAKSPETFAAWGKLAEAYQLRYLARRSIRSRDPKLALKLAVLAIQTNFRILIKEPKRTINTLVCAFLINLLPKSLFCRLESLAITTIQHTNTHIKGLV
jgi:glycosyltransferase involved in cell wall biosynthesis